MDKIAKLPRRAAVTANEILTVTGTFLVSFRAVDDEPFDFEPGQFVSIDCVHPELGYRRSPYCIVTPESVAPEWSLLVRRIEDGPVSVHLSELEPGDAISFGGPAGASMLAEAELVKANDDLILLATGVGISPFLSFVATLAECGFSNRIVLYWGLRLAEDICLLEELDSLADAYPDFDYFISLSQPPAEWDGLRGRLTQTVPPRLRHLANRRFFLSGNGAMIAEMSEALAAVGVSQSFVYEEYFFNTHYRPRWEDVETIASRFTAADAGNLFAHLPPLGLD